MPRNLALVVRRRHRQFTVRSIEENRDCIAPFSTSANVTELSETLAIGKRSGSSSRVRELLAKSTVMDTVSGYLPGSSIFRSAVPAHNRNIGAAFAEVAARTVTIAAIARVRRARSPRRVIPCFGIMSNLAGHWLTT